MSAPWTLPRWLYAAMLAIFAFAAFWLWRELRDLHAVLRPADEAARRLLGLTEVTGGLLLVFCALLGLALWREGLLAWRAAPARKGRAVASWLVALLLLLAGWQLRGLLLERMAARLAPALEEGAALPAGAR